MPPKKAKKTAAGYRMPDHLPPGTILTDLAKKQWVLGQSVGTGGFGEIYLATESGKGEQRVVKIEPHENGPLFVEMHFYISAGKPEHLQDFKKVRKDKDIPHLPMLRGHGSYQHKVSDTYRFLVIDKLGQDLDKTFKNGANPLPFSTVANVSVQVLTALEYIHFRGYTHNDVKAANLLLGLGNSTKDVFLVDFGLCVKYMKGGQEGSHKEYRADPRKAHDGTIEYLSRDAHAGCTSRRSDLEVLGYNIIHWLTGSLPWLPLTNNPAKVQTAKDQFMKDLGKNTVSLPRQVQDFMKYVVGLKFEEEPDYEKLRGYFMAEVKKSGGNLDIGDGSGSKRKSTSKKDSKKPQINERVDEIENNSSPLKKVRKVSAKKAPVVKTDSEEEFEPSPVPAKKSKKGKSRQVTKKPVVESSDDESEDMFHSPSPMKKIPKSLPKYQEAACQTSPAFVAAARAAKKGLKALAQSEYKEANGDSPARVRRTPVRAKGTPVKTVSENSTPSKRSKSKSSEQSSDSIPGISNPTPAMLAIMQKKQLVEDKSKNKKKK